MKDDGAIDAITAALRAPFDPSEVRWKPGNVSGSRALALAYIDARAVMDRLDDVVGVAGWQDRYRELPGGQVVCRLSLKVGGAWVTKMDVGGSKGQTTDAGDKLKGACSDALKRAAVKFGVGRYLARVPRQWVDYDPQKRQLARTPQLPDWALPRPAAPAPPRAATPPAPAAAGTMAAQVAAELERTGLPWEAVALNFGAAGRSVEHLDGRACAEVLEWLGRQQARAVRPRCSRDTAAKIGDEARRLGWSHAFLFGWLAEVLGVPVTGLGQLGATEAGLALHALRRHQPAPQPAAS